MYSTIKNYSSFYREKEHFSDNSILNLIIYHPSPHEDAMKEVLTTYLEKQPMVRYYFITLREHQNDDIVIEGVDPENGRRFWGTKDFQQVWFTLKDIRGLKG